MKFAEEIMLCSILVTIVSFFSATLAASPLPQDFCPGVKVDAWTCRTGDGRPCDEAVQGDISAYRQILVFPIGYQDRRFFQAEAEELRTDMVDIDIADIYDYYGETYKSTMWSSVHRERLLFLTYWVPGGAVDSDDTAFEGQLIDHPIRLGDYRLKVNESLVDGQVETLKESCPSLDPISVVAFFDVTGLPEPTANATPPIYMKRSFGIARISNRFLGYHYVPPHELGHAAMGWFDEYVEPSLRGVNVREFDRLSPLFIFDQGLVTAALDVLEIYNMEVSEILLANGADNVSLVENPGRVTPEGALGSEPYEQEGAYFGAGVYRYMEDQENLMSAEWGVPDQYRQSPVQQRLMNTAFGTGPVRTNDRLVNAGPPSGFALAVGPSWNVMLFDEDKNHRWHPTKRYDIEVQWKEQNWAICKMTVWPFSDYPCLKTETRTVRKSVEPTRELTSIDKNAIVKFGNWALALLCKRGDIMVSDLGIEAGGDINLCEAGGIDSLLTETFFFKSVYLPYQFATIPTPRPFTRYLWRFRSDNGVVESDWTNWSSLERGL